MLSPLPQVFDQPYSNLTEAFPGLRAGKFHAGRSNSIPVQHSGLMELLLHMIPFDIHAGRTPCDRGRILGGEVSLLVGNRVIRRQV